MKTLERNEQRKFETVCFSIPNTFPVAQKSFHLLYRYEFLLVWVFTLCHGLDICVLCAFCLACGWLFIQPFCFVNVGARLFSFLINVKKMPPYFCLPLRSHSRSPVGCHLSLSFGPLVTRELVFPSSLSSFPAKDRVDQRLGNLVEFKLDLAMTSPIL